MYRATKENRKVSSCNVIYGSLLRLFAGINSVLAVVKFCKLESSTPMA
jgi:hypothetical protein